MSNEEKFDELIVLLSKICELRNTKGQIFKAFDDVLLSLTQAGVTEAEFDALLGKLHDRLVRYDSVFRIYGYRALRHLLSSASMTEVFYARNVQYMVIESLEGDHEYLHERMQAIRLIRKCIEVAPQNINLGFVRSLVAIASEATDKFRRLAADTLLDLCIKNPAVVAEANGMRTLFDLMLQPDCVEIIQPIAVSLLFLYNSPDTRQFVQFESNLGSVISPYTDFDSSAADALQRLRSARVALVTIMRSWGGLHALSQSEVGLRALSKLLCDSKVSADIQDAVLDVLAEVLEPVVSRTNSYTKPNKLAGLKKLSTKNLHRPSSTGPPAGLDILRSPSASVSISMQRSASAGNLTVSPRPSSGGIVSPPTVPEADPHPTRFRTVSQMSEKDRPSSRLSVDDDDDDDVSSESGSVRSHTGRSRSGSQVILPSGGAPTTPIPENEVVDLTDHSRRKTKDSKEGSGEKKEGRRSLKNFLAMSRNISSSPIKDFLLGGAAMHKKASSFESEGNTATTGSISPPDSETSPGSIFRPPRVQHRRASDNPSGTWADKIAEEQQSSGRAKSRTVDLGVRTTSNNPVSLGFLLNGCDEMDMPTLERTFSVRSSEDIERPRADPLYNLLDTYGVILCVALLRAGFFRSLCTVSTLGSAALSDKARKILVRLLSVISRLFPDRTCAQLLSDPSLIEYASTFASLKLSDRALKASQLLLSLSSAFSLSRGRGGFTANSIMSNNSSTRYAAADSGSVLDTITGYGDGLSVGNRAVGEQPNKVQAASTAPTGNDFLASRIREHRVTRVVSDVLDEIAHTAFSRVSRIIGTAAALKDNNPEAFKNRHVRGKSDPQHVHSTTRNSLANLMFGDKQNIFVSNMTSDRSSISSELLATPLKNADRGGQTREDLMYEIKIVVMPLVDKLEFGRQMEASRVVGKEGKEPFRWDWSMLSEMLEYCVRYPERLQEAMKTKWVKRLCGFFRCSSDDKGYFSNLDWYPSNLHYLECACHLYGVLVEQENNQTPFLGVDRRGMLFAEIVSEIEYLISLASRVGGSKPSLATAHPAGHLVTNNVSPATSRSVFRLYGCTQLMAREYFTLLGRLCSTPAGRSLVEGNQIYGVLSTLGQHACLDYLSRVALTSISFTDEGFMSQNMLQILPVSVGSSDGMKRYSHMLLRSLLRSRDPRANAWMVETVSAQLLYENMPTKSVIRVLEEIVQDSAYIKMLSNSISQLMGIPGTEPILIRLLAVPEGIEQMQKFKWIVPNVKAWLAEGGGCHSYSEAVEISLFDSLCVKHSPCAVARKTEFSPIPIACRPYSVHPQAPRRFSWYPDGGADIEGLLRAPWNMECRIGSQPAGQRSAGKLAPPDYIRMDSFLDASDLPSSASGDTISDDLRIIKVRGVIIDDKGLPSAILVPADRTLSACLLCGVCPIYRDGRVYADPTQSSAAGHSSSMGNSGPSASGNTVASAANSIMTQRRKYTRNTESSGGIFNDRHVHSGAVQENVDPPLTYHTEHLQDWSYCKPSQRQTATHQRDIGGGRICVEIPGDPVCWIFSKTNPFPPPSPKVEGGGSVAGKTKVHDAVKDGLESIAISQRLAQEHQSNLSGVMYLVEVHFMLKLITGDPTIVPMRRHMFGELSRTLHGCKILQDEGVVPALLAEAKLKPAVDLLNNNNIKLSVERDSCTPIEMQRSTSADSLLLFDDPPADSAATSHVLVNRIKSAVWALGHIGSTDNGFEIIQQSDSHFVSWCIQMATTSDNFSLRSVCFSALGLLSRSDKSKEIFTQLGWDCSSNDCCAVAIPSDLLQIYKPLEVDVRVEPIATPSYGVDLSSPTKAQSRINRVYLYSLITGVIDVQKKELYCDVLECIAKLPGHILYKETKGRLAKLHSAHPEIFADRDLYLSTHQVLLLFSFTLAIRRHVCSLFHVDARLEKGTTASPRKQHL